MRVLQLTENLLPGDAISSEVLALDTALRSLGYETALYAAADRCGRGARHPGRLKGDVRADDLLLYQFSIGSALNDWFAVQPCRKAIFYQNITPAAFFDPWDPPRADLCRLGREQLAALIPKLDFAIAGSEFSAAELRELACRDVAVLPILLDGNRFAVEPDPALLSRLSDGKKNILFVGRKAPNKRIEELLLATEYYSRVYRRPCRLVLCGDDSLTRYCKALQRLRSRLTAEVVWLGRVSQAELAACYKSADVFLCLSEHEGFCVPLAECMVCGVPILARRAACVPETLGGAGLLLDSAELPEIAEKLEALLTDESLRARVIGAGRERLHDFSAARTVEQLGRILRDRL